MFKMFAKLSADPKAIITKAGKDIGIKKLKELNSYDVYVGWAADAKASDGDKVVSIAQYAKANNFGVFKMNIPPRPFMNNAMENKKYIKQREEVIRRGMQAIKRNIIVPKDLFTLLGIEGVKNVRDSIKTGNWIPNAPSTYIRKMRKAGGKKNGKGVLPLIDTGQMIDRVTYEVRIRK